MKQKLQLAAILAALIAVFAIIIGTENPTLVFGSIAVLGFAISCLQVVFGGGRAGSYVCIFGLVGMGLTYFRDYLVAA